MQLYNQSHLPAVPDDMLGSTALGPVGGASAGPSPMKKIHRLLRGREKVAITLAILFALAGAAAGWLSQKPQYMATGTIQIHPIIPSLAQSEHVMPFYNYFVQSQTAIITSPNVLNRAAQSNEWKATGLPSNSDGGALIKQNLEVTYAKNSQHILIDYIDDRADVAQAAVHSVIKAYQAGYSEANGQEMTKKIKLLEAARDERDNAIKGIKMQINALTGRHGSDDLKAMFDTANEHLTKLRDDVRKAKMTLESAQSSMPKEGEVADATKGLTLEAIAAQDATMREYLRTKDAMEFRLAQLRRNLGDASRVVQDAKSDIAIQQQRIDAYATEYRKNFVGGQYFDFDRLQMIPLTKQWYDQIVHRTDELQKLYEHDAAEFKLLSEDWSKILELKSEVERNRTELEKLNRQYDENSTQLAMGGTLDVVDDGSSPPGPAPDKRKQFAFVGFVGGGCLPIGLLLLIGLMDGKMRYSEEAGADMSGMTLLGILPNLPDRLTDPAQAATAAHCVHQIRTMLQINAGEDHNVFAVTSASPGDGKTSLTLALGLSFAASGSRTLLIDCDLVGAGLTSRLDMGGPNGVLEAMANKDILQYCRQTDIADLSMLPVGQAQAHHAGMFSPQALRRLITEARKHFEIILIDSGPVLGSIEATPVCAAADGVILTVSRGQQRPLVEKAIQHLISIGARFAGVVFNRAQARDFARSISGISLRSIARQHQSGANGHPATNGGPKGGAFGPVARAVASSVKPQD
jgi:capsular exopolysaccharide synthesis family protein